MLRLLTLCHVPRWSIVPHSRSQSVAEHSYRVAAIAREIARRYSEDKSLETEVVYLAISHDEDESLTGDIPGPFKHDAMVEYFGKPTPTKDLTLPQAIVKIADRIEAYTYIAMYGRVGDVTRQAIDYTLRNVNLPLADLEDQKLTRITTAVMTEIVKRGV